MDKFHVWVLPPYYGAQRPISENKAMLKEKEGIATCQIKPFFSDDVRKDVRDVLRLAFQKKLKL